LPPLSHLGAHQVHRSDFCDLGRERLHLAQTAVLTQSPVDQTSELSSFLKDAPFSEVSWCRREPLVHRCSWPDGGGTHLDTGFQEVPARHFASRRKVCDALASFRASEKVRSPNLIPLGILSAWAPHFVHTPNCAAHLYGPNALELLTVRSSRATSGQDL
jgi:hypothetical protein